MKILLLNETEFLGGHVLTYLQNWGHQVAVLSSVSSTSLRDSPIIIGDDRSGPDFSSEVIALFAPDIVIGLPGALPPAMLKDQRLQTATTRLVYCGTIEVYRAFARHTGEEPGEPDLVPLIEDDSLRKEGDDVVQEHLVRSSFPSSTILRLASLYGPGRSSHAIRSILDPMDSKTAEFRLPTEIAQWRCASAYVQDAAFAIALAAKSSDAAGQTYNVADAFAFTRYDWIKAIGRAAGWDGSVALSETDAVDGKNYQQHIIVDSTKIRQELGYAEKSPINEALTLTVEWERANRQV